METLINNLEKILEGELQLHASLLSAATAMNEAIKKQDVAGVMAASKRHDELACQIEALEEKRLSTSDKILGFFNESSHANLLRIIELLPKNQGQRLSDLRLKLRATLSNIHKTTISNRILLQESLQVIAKTFEIISTETEKAAGYKQLGKKNTVKINRTIINTMA